MRQFLVQDNSIVGDFTGIAIAGYSVIEADIPPDVDIADLFIDRETIKVKPPRTNETDVWDDSTHTWVEIQSAIERLNPATNSTPLPHYGAVNFALSPGGSHEPLLMKALYSQAPALLQGSLPSAIAFGNLPAIKASLEAIVAGMPQDKRYTVEEVHSLGVLFKENNIPLTVQVIKELAGVVESINLAIVAE